METKVHYLFKKSLRGPFFRTKQSLSAHPTVNVSHHIEDKNFQNLLAQISRVLNTAILALPPSADKDQLETRSCGHSHANRLTRIAKSTILDTTFAQVT